MRHYSSLKALMLLSLVLAACAWADEASDRVAIDRTIAALNTVPQRPELFTRDSDAAPVLEQLWKANRRNTRVSPSAPASVTISHEPWGEATINIPAVEMLNPRIASSAVRFITLDVALADGVFTNDNGSTIPQTTPLLFVMKKEGNDWKIASLRVLR